MPLRKRKKASKLMETRNSLLFIFLVQNGQKWISSNKKEKIRPQGSQCSTNLPLEYQKEPFIRAFSSFSYFLEIAFFLYYLLAYSLLDLYHIYTKVGKSGKAIYW